MTTDENPETEQPTPPDTEPLPPEPTEPEPIHAIIQAEPATGGAGGVPLA